MKPKIAIILTSDGIDTVTVLSSGTEARKAGFMLCTFLEDEIREFESSLLKKLKQKGERLEEGNQH